MERWENYTDNYDGTYDDPDEEADRPKGFAVQESRPTYKGPADCNIDRKYGIATPPWLNQDSPKARRRLLLSDSWSISNPNRFAEPVKMVTTPIRVRNHPRYLGLDASLWLDPTLDDLPPSGQKVGPEPGRLNEDDQDDDDDDDDDDENSVISSKLEYRDTSVNKALLVEARKLRKEAGKVDDKDEKARLYRESQMRYTSVLKDKADPLVVHFSEALYGLGVCFRKQGRFQKAVDAYRHSLMLDPSGCGGSVHNNLAQALTLLGLHDEAKGAHIQALNITRLKEENAKTHDIQVHPSFFATLQEVGLIGVHDKYHES